MKKRLIVCADGTWQDLYQPCPTNVVKMAQAIRPTASDNIPQLIYYDEGLGTRQIDIQRSIIDRLLKIGGGALGLGIDRKIQRAYCFLCLNYEPGDEIFLFGFSRGAYTVRCLAGLIYNAGLLHREHIRQIPKAYELYRDKKDPDKKPGGKKSIEFREKFGRNVPIKALCCWDTVASVGFPDLIPWLKLDQAFNERYSFYDSKINPMIEKGIHAVAIDEIRKVFDVTRMESSKTDQVTQVWFPGGHGCVGGGSEDEQGLSDGALQWMMEQVQVLGLELNIENVENGIKPNYKADFNNKPKPPFNIGSPNIREVTGTFTDLHESVKQRWVDPTINPPYRPVNLQKFKSDLDSYKS